ncbi:MAG: hypothetical protein ACYTG0_32125, partial [Planctomycetota bacterium]
MYSEANRASSRFRSSIVGLLGKWFRYASQSLDRRPRFHARAAAAAGNAVKLFIFSQMKRDPISACYS